MASIKNAQFVESGPQDNSGPQASRADEDKDYLLQLGKTTDDCFNMDFTHPLSLLQAFAICVARFDAKLSW
jgi:tubby-related protein 1